MRGIPPDGCIGRWLCGCVEEGVRSCSHEIVEFVRDDKPIPLDMVDSFWRKPRIWGRLWG
ncbi:hypothetical protein OROHE_019078 [Orobanche hederae]